MTAQELIRELAVFIQAQLQFILADLYEKRFANKGQFNDHPEWAPNERGDIVYEKYDKPAMIDTGELKATLTNPANWEVDIDVKTNKLEVRFPDKENFTDSKYDSLEDSSGGEYYGTRTGKLIKFKRKAPREFKTIDSSDVDWVTQQLKQKIRERFSA